ncbi:MAG: hypothetical protein ACJ8AK_15145 [Gemmatimonadaceae bacterium]
MRHPGDIWRIEYPANDSPQFGLQRDPDTCILQGSLQDVVKRAGESPTQGTLRVSGGKSYHALLPRRTITYLPKNRVYQ